MKHTQLTHEQVVGMLKAKQGKLSLRKFAVVVKISAPYLSDVYKGRRGIGPTLQEYLGLERDEQTTVTYFKRKP
jgi:transcriptional regulator with XRE-family HTH domain